ncbi:MAG: LysR family transcriptional regulator [Phenylobacterium sp.]|uniref:LysR family transcriptional regulator n=1 Tax=Phenylobacterium sp. TaxID=1871053 RepID=UPI001A4B2FF9|nr:LysR family transcriptional regulator [Phenylobacterium sp.]MBL8555129.1 LysR family transcriptional regulator [Phenylobacterium sp.]
MRREATAAQDIAALRSALMVREHLGFRRASEVLGVNPSVLSRRVLALEDALGVSLFQRSPGGARPTGAGERFLSEVERALELLARAAVRAGAAGRGEVGRLRLGHVWPVTAGPAETLLRAYRRSAESVELELRAGSAAELVAALLDRELDAVLIDADDAPPGLDRLTLWAEPWLVARPLESPEDALGAAPVLCAAGDDWGRIRRLVTERGGARAGVRVQMTSHDGVLSLVAAGAGHAVVPQSVAQSTRAAVAFSPLPGPAASLRLTAAWLGDHDNPALRRFVSLLRASPPVANPLGGGATVQPLRAAGASR